MSHRNMNKDSEIIFSLVYTMFFIISIILLPNSIKLIFEFRIFILGAILYTFCAITFFFLFLLFTHNYITGNNKEYKGARKFMRKGAAIIFLFTLNPLIIIGTIFCLSTALLPGNLILFLVLLIFFFFFPSISLYFFTK